MVDSTSSTAVLAVILPTGDPAELLKPLAGHPLVAYSAAAALQSRAVSQVWVAAEDGRVVDAIRQYAGRLRRPDVTIRSLPGVSHSDRAALAVIREELTHRGAPMPEVVVFLRPQWPLHPRGSLDQAIDRLICQVEAYKLVSLAPVRPARRLWAEGQGGEPVSIQSPGCAGPADSAAADSSALIGHPRLYAETGHFEAFKLADIPTARITLTQVLDPQYDLSVVEPLDREWAAWTIQFARLDLVYPGHRPRPLPPKVSLLVMDFDGVLTDNRVWVDENGHEQVAANRSDSLGLVYLRQAGIEALVISKETNPVVTARCRKMKVPVLQGIDHKAAALQQYLLEQHIDPMQVVYLGNDVNDLPCFPVVACAAAVADSQPAVLRQADLVLTCHGGHAAVRELCDLLISNKGLVSE